jgi:F-type H+-transporting ATPase subunit delta
MGVAQRMYARALFEAAQEQGKLAEVHEQLGDFVAMVEEVPELGAVLANPEVDSKTKAAILDDVLGGADELVRNFLRLIAEKGRTGEIVEIARELGELVAKQDRVLQVELTTAFELSDEEAQGILEQIEQASGRSVEATRSVDPDLVGGIVLQAGSLRLDASVRGRLERLRHDLVTRS